MPLVRKSNKKLLLRLLFLKTVQKQVLMWVKCKRMMQWFLLMAIIMIFLVFHLIRWTQKFQRTIKKNTIWIRIIVNTITYHRMTMIIICLISMMRMKIICTKILQTFTTINTMIPITTMVVKMKTWMQISISIISQKKIIMIQMTITAIDVILKKKSKQQWTRKTDVSLVQSLVLLVVVHEEDLLLGVL